MSNKGVITKGIYRKALTALAMMMVMSVVFAFTFTAQTHKIHAGTKTASVKTWKELKTKVAEANADKENTYEITLNEDLVALDQIDITGKVVLKGNKTIYRHSGATDFSVFKVTSGELELGQNVVMTGKTAKVKQDRPGFDDGSSAGGGAFTIIWKAGWGNHQGVWSTDKTLTSVKIGNQDVAVSVKQDKTINPGDDLINSIPAGSLWDLSKDYPEYEFEGWRVEGYKESELKGTWSQSVINGGKLKVPATDKGTLVVVAQWKLKQSAVVDAKNSTNVRPASQKYGGIGGGGLGGRLNGVDGKQIVNQGELIYDHVNADGSIEKRYAKFPANIWGGITNSPPQIMGYSYSEGNFQPWYVSGDNKPGNNETNFFMRVAGSEYLRLNPTNNTLTTIDMKSNTEAEKNQKINDAYNQWNYDSNGFLINKGNPNYYINVDSNGILTIEKVSLADTASKDPVQFKDSGLSDGSKPSWTPVVVNTIDGTEIDTDDSDEDYSVTPQDVKYWNGDAGEDTAGNPVEKFSGKISGATNDQGFFVQVENGGKLKISGATLEEFNTVTIDADNEDDIDTIIPKEVAPVYVKGELEMTGGAIQKNAVGYVGIESRSNDNVRNIQKYLGMKGSFNANGEFVKDASAVPMTNTAGGVIFTGENATGTISGGTIGSNKGDAGGIIVTNKAFVTLNNNGKINGNLGFHHAGAVLVDNGGTLNMQGGEMANNVTWAKGGAVWATQWGTNGYVVSDWRKWPKEYPEVKNPTVAGEHGNFIMNGGTIHDNTAFIRAGAIEVESNGVELYKGQIYDNNCRSLGGAIYVEGDALDYSYTLYVKQGYIGNNMSVTKDSTVKANGLSSAYNNKEVNIDILDRYLDGTGKLSAQGTERGKTYDPDFYGALGNGGGVWLCPVGGTSVFAKDGSGVNKVTIDNNQATRTGTDFYLHKGNGSVMVQNLQGEWYEQDGSGDYKTNPKEQKTFAGENGTILRGMLAMKNDAYEPDKTAAAATNNYAADTGIMIYNNKSRDGGGIACNGTLMLGGPDDVYRYDAKINLSKKWDVEDNIEGKKATFRVYLKNTDGSKGPEITEKITLDGTADASDSSPNTLVAEGEIDPTTEDGKVVWNAGVFLPSVVDVPGRGKVPTYVFYDPTDPKRERIFDVSDPESLKNLKDALLAKDDHTLALPIKDINFIIEEDGNEYDLEIEEPFTVIAEAEVDVIQLNDPVTGKPKEGAGFHVTFSQATFKVKAINKDKPIDVPVSKTWLRSDGYLELSKKTTNNSGDAYYNWPSSGNDSLSFTLSGNDKSSTQSLTRQQVEALLTGSTTGLGNNVEITNATGGLASRELVYKDGQGKVLYKVGLERKDYAMYFIGDELIYAEPYEEAKTNAASYAGDTEEAKIKAYIADKAQQELDSVERSETASASNVKLDDANKRVLFPKLIFLADKYDSEGQAIEYTVTENDVTGYRKQVARVGETNAFRATNTSTRINIPAEKKWVNRYNVAEATKNPNGLDTGSSLGTKEYVNWPVSGADSIKFALAKGGSKYNQVITAQAIQKLITGDATGLGNNAEMLNADQAIENRSIVYTRNAYTATVSLEKQTYRAIFIGDEMIYGEEESECRENTKAHFNVDTDLNPTTHWVDYIALNAKRVMDAQHRPYTYSDVNDTTVDIGWAKADTYTVYVPKVTYTVTDGNYTFDEPEIMNGTVNVKNNGYKVTTSGDKTTVFTATNKEDRKDIYATKEWKDKKGNLILTQTTGNNTDFSSILNGNKYLNWPGSGVNWIRLKIESTAAGAGALDTHIDIDVKDLEDILVRNSLRSGKASSTVKFHADTDVEKRYIEYLGSGANAGKTIARLAVKKTNETVNGQDVEVYTPIVRFVVDNDGDYNVVETGMNTESGGFGKYNVTYDQTSNPRVITNAVDSKEIPANKTWLDANGVVMATKKPNGLDLTNNLQTENNYLKFINWPESGVSSYVLTLSGGTPATRNYTISLTDIKPLVTGNESDMTDASAAKKFNGGDNIEDRYIEWNDNRGTAKLSLKKQEYFIVYDINGNIVYAEPKEEAMEHTRDEYGSEYHSSGKWEADYMIAKAKEKLVERGMTQAEADRLVLRGSHGGEAKPENGFVNYGEKVYLYTPVITYIVEGKNDQGSVINYTLDETAVANYDKSVTGSHSEGFDVSNRYNKVEISATKKWIDYNDNVLMTQSFGSHQFKVNGESVWVNWPSANTEYVRVKLEDKAASPAWSREDTLNANTIKDYLANPNNSWPAGRGTASVKFDKKNYYVVLDKDTNEVVLTVPTSDVSYTDETEAHQYVTSLAVNKTGKKSSDLKVEERLVYFPKVVYNINRNSSGTTLAQYVITELGVGSGEYSATDMRTDDYFPTYYKNNGTEFDPTDNITDATKHMGMMEAGITICNERKVNVKLTKKWRSGGTEIPMPPGVTAEFQLMKYDEKQKKFVDVTGNDAKKTLTSGSTLEWTGLEPGRYAVRESGVPDSYVTDMPTDGTAEVTITKNSIGQDVFEYTATNKELTTVEAEKKWNGSTTWPSGISSVNLYLKRWYRYDSFGNPIWQRILNDTTTSSSNTDRLYIDKPVGTKKYVTVDSNTNKYYVKDGDKNYDVINNGYVEIDGMIYALQGGKLVTVSGKQYNDSIIRDHNDDYKKVLVDPKNKEGIAITSAKALKNGQKATWTELPKYDDKYPVHDGLTEAKKKEIRKIEYWALEETPSGYLEVITCSENGNKFELTVNNTKTQFLQVEAQKVWDDGNSANRPTIRFELWRQTHSSYSGWQSGTDQYWSKLNGSDKYGQPYDRIITSESNTSDLTQRWVKLPDSETKSGVTYSYNYAPREALLVGQDKDGKDVYVYVNSLSRAISNLINHDAPYNQGVIEVTYNTSTELYTINVWALNSNGQKTDILIDGPKTVKTLDKRAIDYQNGKVNAYIAKVDYSRPDGSTVCWAHDMVVRNTRPAIEKYVNQDVHQDLQTKEEIFTYDIMAYVPEGSKEVKIYDPLVKALEFVDKNGKGQSQSGYKAGTNLSNVVEVAYMDTNNHKAISVDANGSVTQAGTKLATNQYTATISRKPTNGSPLGSTDDATYKTNLESYINLTDAQYENKLTVTLPESTLSGNTTGGKWVKVTFKAKIRDDIDFANLEPTQRQKLGFETISKNDPVQTNITNHTGFKNKASYDVKLGNNYKYENIPSNEVTVVPPTSLKVEKKVTGTLGDVNKEFVFKIEMTGLQNNGGEKDPSTKRDYYYGASVNGADGPKAYMDADLNDSTHRTYNNGFNVNPGTNVSKTIWVKLKAGQSIEIKGLPVGATYKVTELPSDHVPTYSIKDANTVVKEATRPINDDDVAQGRLVKDGGKWIKATADMVGQSKTVALNIRAKDNAGSGQELATAQERVDAGEDVTITYTNHRDIETQTGIIKDTWPWNIILLVLLILLAYDDQMRKIKNRLRLQRLTTTV